MKTTMRILVLLLVTTLCRSHGADDLRQSELLRLLPGSGVDFAVLVDLERCRAQELPMLPIAFSRLLRDVPEDVLDGMAELLILGDTGGRSGTVICCRPKHDGELDLWEEFDSEGEIVILPTNIPGAEEVEVKKDTGGALVLRVSPDLWLVARGIKAEALVPSVEKQLAQQEPLSDAPPAMKALLGDVPAASMAIALWPGLNIKHGLRSPSDFIAGLAWPAEAMIVNILPGAAAKQVVIQARARYADAAEAQVVVNGVKAFKPLGSWIERSLAELARQQETPEGRGIQPVQGFFNILSKITAELDGTLLLCDMSMDLAQEPAASMFSGMTGGRTGDLACMNNLKQIGLAIMQYAADHQDTLPGTLAELEPYVGNKRVFRCQAMPKSRGQNNLYLYLLPAGTKLKDIKEPSRTMATMDTLDAPHPQVAILFADGHVQQVERAGLKTPAEIAAKFNFILLPQPAPAE